MKIDYEKLERYAALDDESLWSLLRSLGAQHGYTLPQSVPPREDMDKLRSLMRGTTRIGMSEAMKILNKYKTKKG